MSTATRNFVRFRCAIGRLYAPSSSPRCRFRVTIGRLIALRLERPLPSNAHALSHLLHVAAAQVLFLDVPDSAAVDLAVTHAKSDPRTARFAGLVNGVLRGMRARQGRRAAENAGRNR